MTKLPPVMTPEQVSAAVGLPIKQIDDMVGDGLFPAPRRFTAKVRRWAGDLVEQYLEAKAALPQEWERPVADFNVMVWPPKGLKVLRFDSHRKCGIYFLMRDGKVTYVGSSKNIYSRVGDHSQSKRFDYVRWIKVKEKKLYGVERDWILSLKPPLNGYAAKTGERIYCAPRAEHRRFRMAGGMVGSAPGIVSRKGVGWGLCVRNDTTPLSQGTAPSNSPPPDRVRET